MVATSATAVSNTAAVAGATAVESVVNSGMLVYWQSQGVQSNLVSTPTGTYVVPAINSGQTAGGAAAPQNPYETQNNQQTKQDFFNN